MLWIIQHEGRNVLGRNQSVRVLIEHHNREWLSDAIGIARVVTIESPKLFKNNKRERGPRCCRVGPE